jgi:RNA polymerase primary sigma factor
MRLVIRHGRMPRSEFVRLFQVMRQATGSLNTSKRQPALGDALEKVTDDVILLQRKIP